MYGGGGRMRKRSYHIDHAYVRAFAVRNGDRVNWILIYLSDARRDSRRKEFRNHIFIRRQAGDYGVTVRIRGINRRHVAVQDEPCLGNWRYWDAHLRRCGRRQLEKFARVVECFFDDPDTSGERRTYNVHFGAIGGEGGAGGNAAYAHDRRPGVYLRAVSCRRADCGLKAQCDAAGRRHERYCPRSHARRVVVRSAHDNRRQQRRMERIRADDDPRRRNRGHICDDDVVIQRLRRRDRDSASIIGDRYSERGRAGVWLVFESYCRAIRAKGDVRRLHGRTDALPAAERQLLYRVCARREIADRDISQSGVECVLREARSKMRYLESEPRCGRDPCSAAIQRLFLDSQASGRRGGGSKRRRRKGI